MSYFGPYLEPGKNVEILLHLNITPDACVIGPQDCSIWSWLFDQQLPEISDQRGFRDGNTNELLSFAELKALTIWMSNSLARDFGLQAQQTVAIVSRNSIWYPAAMLAASRLGAVVTCLPPDAKKQDLCYFFEASHTILVFADKEASAQVHAACRDLNIGDDRMIVLDGRPEEPSSLRNVIERGKASKSQVSEPVRGTSGMSGSQCAFLSFSSGTTGKPKAVSIVSRFPKQMILSHFYLYEELCLFEVSRS